MAEKKLKPTPDWGKEDDKIFAKYANFNKTK